MQSKKKLFVEELRQVVGGKTSRTDSTTPDDTAGRTFISCGGMTTLACGEEGVCSSC